MNRKCKNLKCMAPEGLQTYRLEETAPTSQFVDQSLKRSIKTCDYYIFIKLYCHHVEGLAPQRAAPLSLRFRCSGLFHERANELAARPQRGRLVDLPP